MEIDTITAPSVWAGYIINNDKSGVGGHDMAAADRHFRGWRVLDVEDGSERFTWHYKLYGGDAEGGSVSDYTVALLKG